MLYYKLMAKKRKNQAKMPPRYKTRSIPRRVLIDIIYVVGTVLLLIPSSFSYTVDIFTKPEDVKSDIDQRLTEISQKFSNWRKRWFG
jgi:hypothetical protein